MDGQNTNNKKKNLKEIVLYLIFGVATTLVNWIVYLLFNNLIFNRYPSYMHLKVPRNSHE